MAATDFFQQQDSARRKTVQLVIYFILSIVILIALVYALLLGFGVYGGVEPVSWWQPQLLLLVAAGVGVVVGGASVFKVAQLASGGKAVALMMGGEEVPGTTTDAREKGCSTSPKKWPSPRECRCPPSMFWRSPASMPSRPATPPVMPWSRSPEAPSII